jgi:hypothetical protein
MSFERTSENRSANIVTFVPFRRRLQCCSFCRERGHNITTCNSDRLSEFENICSMQVRNMTSRHDFKNWIMQNYIHDQVLLKTFAIRKFYITSGASVYYCVDLITDYMFRHYRSNPITQDETDNLVNILHNLRNHRQNINNTYQHSDYNRLLQILYSMLLPNRIPHINSDEPRIYNISSHYVNNENENIQLSCECNICWEEKEVKNFVKLDCNHEFCKDCVVKSLRADHRTIPCCALCRADIHTLKSRTMEINDELNSIF